MIVHKICLQIFLIGLISSAVHAQVTRWSHHLDVNDKANSDYYLSGTVTFICPNGVVLFTNTYFTDSFQADNNLPSWNDCVPSLIDDTIGSVTLNVSSTALESYIYPPQTITIAKYDLFYAGLEYPSLTRIGFRFTNYADLSVSFLGPSCGDNKREFFQGEDCDMDTDDNCVFCSCVEGTYADYEELLDRSCSLTPISPPFQLFSLLLGLGIPIAFIAIVVPIVLRVLCIKGVIGRRKANKAMEMDIRRQQAAEREQAEIVQPDIVPLDDGVQPGQPVVQVIAPYNNFSASNANVFTSPSGGAFSSN